MMKQTLLLILMLAGLASAHTTITVNPDEADTPPNYLSLSLAEAALPDPLTDDYIINCASTKGTNDTTPAVINVATLNGATQHTLTINGNNTTGIFDDAKYHLKVAGTQTAITINSHYVTFDGLQVTGIVTSYQGIYAAATYTNITIKNCLIQDFTKTGGYAGIYFDATTAANRYAYNNVIWNCTNGIYTNASTCTVAHNTIVGCTTGLQIVRGGSCVTVVKDNLVSGGTTCWNLSGSGGTITTAYNYTSDATSPDGAGYQSKTFTFIGGEDYHLNASEAGLYDCVDPTISGLTTDIDGESRTVWTAGADELASAWSASGNMHAGMLLGNHRRRQ